MHRNGERPVVLAAKLLDVGVVLWVGIAVVVASGAWFGARAFVARFPRRLIATASLPLDGEERRVVLGPSQQPYFALQLPTPRDRERRREPIVLSKTAIAALAPLLEQTPRLLAAPTESETKLVLTFVPARARELALGTAARELARSDRAFHAIAKGRSGRVVEHGELVTRAEPRSVLVALWALAGAMVVKRLALDLDARLAGLSDRIVALRTSLGNTFAARLEAAVETLGTRCRAFRDGALPPEQCRALVPELERIDRETRAISAEVLSEMAAVSQRLSGSKWGGVFGVRKETDEARDAIRAVASASDKVLATVQVRLLTLTLRVGVASDAGSTDEAMKALTADLSSHRKAWRTFVEALKAKLPELVATLRRRRTDERLQDELRRELDEAAAAALAAAEQSSRLLMIVAADVAEERAAPTRTIEIELTLAPDGKPMRADRLLRT